MFLPCLRLWNYVGVFTLSETLKLCSCFYLVWDFACSFCELFRVFVTSKCIPKLVMFQAQVLPQSLDKTYHVGAPRHRVLYLSFWNFAVVLNIIWKWAKFIDNGYLDWAARFCTLYSLWFWNPFPHIAVSPQNENKQIRRTYFPRLWTKFLPKMKTKANSKNLFPPPLDKMKTNKFEELMSPASGQNFVQRRGK